MKFVIYFIENKLTYNFIIISNYNKIFLILNSHQYFLFNIQQVFLHTFLFLELLKNKYNKRYIYLAEKKCNWECKILKYNRECKITIYNNILKRKNITLDYNYLSNIKESYQDLIYKESLFLDIHLHGRASSDSYNDAETVITTNERKSINSEIRRIDNTAQSMSSRDSNSNFQVRTTTAICIILLSALS